MINITGGDIVALVVGALMVLGGDILRQRTNRALKAGTAQGRLARMLPKVGLLLMALGAWLFISTLLPILFGRATRHGGIAGLSVELAPERHMLGGFSVSETIITTWIAMAVILLIAIVLRITVVPRMKQVPSGAQHVLEIAVEAIDNYAKSKAGGLGENLSAYLFSVALLMVSCAMVELFGLRAPTADICMTFALALITFVLFNYYGIKRKGPIGRVKSLGNGPVIVLRLISDCAIPVSMACRLFGNMLGGMIVMDLIYSALGSKSVAIPSVFGLYFNVFHPLIQAYIFITLTLTFINEAIE